MDYTTVTEAVGTPVTREALSMVYTRYRYAAEYAAGKDVLEIACGSGQGTAYLARRARKIVGGDYTAALLRAACQVHRGRFPLLQLDAHALPVRAASVDVVLLYEAIYYLDEPERFLGECRRVLRDQGVLLICSVNKEWPDFNPSPYSVRYFTACELGDLLRTHGFCVDLRGAFPVTKPSPRAAIVSLLKRTAVALHLVPRTMKGKALLKRLFLGALVPLPPELTDGLAEYCAPVPISGSGRVSDFKVLFAVGRMERGGSAP